MGMFTNYESIADNYIPNNMRSSCPPKEEVLQPCGSNKPYTDYDSNGKVQGYWWYYGDTVTLDFNITGEVTFENSEESNEEIKVDEDKLNIEPKQDGGYILASDFFKDKKVIIQLYNFRQEEMIIDKQLLQKVYEYEDLIINEDNSVSVLFQIDKTISSKLLRGVYYISLKVISDDIQETLFNTSSAIFTVK